MREPVDSTAEAGLYRRMEELHLHPLWRLQGLLTPTPVGRTTAHRWDGGDLLDVAREAGRLVSVDRGGDRRAIACANPGLDGRPYATGPAWVAVQFLGPGERAPAHRHTPAALRFVLHGSGAWTSVDGEAHYMAPGDLILTPSWSVHEHINNSSDPLVWLDVLDLPIVEFFEAIFYTDVDDETKVPDMPGPAPSERRMASGPGLLPVDVAASARSDEPAERLHAFRWSVTDATLDNLTEPAGYATVRFVDPRTGRDPMPTLTCEMTRVLAGVRSPSVRETGPRVLCVFRGHGRVTVGDVAFDLSAGDVVTVPSWTHWALEAGDDRLDVFSVSNESLLSLLGIHRREVVR